MLRVKTAQYTIAKAHVIAKRVIMDMHMLRTWKIGRGTNQVYGKRDKNIFHSWKTTILVDIQFAVICYGKTASL